MIIEAREDTITLRGSITTNIWPAIQAAAALLLRNHPTGIIVDSAGVDHVTAKGAQTFEDAFRYIKAHNARIVVAGLAPELLEIGKAVPGVRSQLPLASTVEEARASLQLEEIKPERGRARIAAAVPLLGNWARAVYLTDKLALGESCEVHLLDLIKVPLTLPIGSPQPEREVAGQQRMEAARAEVQGMGLQSFGHVERVRSYSAGLADYVGRLGANYAVVSIDRGNRPDPYIEESDAMTLLEMAEFEVSLVKSSPSDPMHPIVNPVVPAVGDWQHALEHACKLVSGPEAAVTVVYLITIPRAEPIDIAKPDAEAAASDCEKEAARIARRYGVKASVMIERVRDPILAFLRMFESAKFDLAVVGVKRETQGDYHIARAIATSLLQEPPCETVFLRTGKAGL